MKKLLSFVTILSFLMQVVPFEVKAEPVYDDMWESGDIITTPLYQSSVLFQNFDYDSTPKFNDTNSSGSNTAFYLVMPSGDLVLYHAFSPTNTLRCLTLASNYTANCGWAGSGYSISTTRTYDPVAGTNSAAANVVGALDFALGGAISPEGDIWLAYYYDDGGLGDGYYLVRTYFSNGSPVSVAYDVDYGDSPNIGPFEMAFDHFGKLWFTKGNIISSTGSNVYCLDRDTDTDTNGIADYYKCTESAFDSEGGLVLDTNATPTAVGVNSDSDIFVVGQNNAKLYKINHADFSVTSTAITGGIQPMSIAIDGSDNIWVTTYHTSTSKAVVCYTSALVSCGVTLKYPYGLAGDLHAPGVPFFDKNGDLWALETGNFGTDVSRIYCWDMPSGTPCADTGAVYNGNANFTHMDGISTPHCTNPVHGTSGACTGAGEVWISTYEYSYIEIGDSSGGATAGATAARSDYGGYKLMKLMDIVAGQDQAQVTATVDPVISFEIRNAADNGVLTDNVCSLGTLSASATSTCEYRLGIETNATNGFTVYYDANGGLISGSDEINAVGEDTVTTGVEEYGLAFSDATGIVDPQGNFTTADSSVPNSSTLVLSSSGPYDYQVGSLGTSTLVTHKASISTVTPAGSYSQVVTITVTGNF